MSGQSGGVVINVATGHEDADRVTVTFLVATAALERGRPVWVTQMSIHAVHRRAAMFWLSRRDVALVSAARALGDHHTLESYA